MEEAKKGDLNPYFVTGLVDGEGCFTYSKCNNNISPRFLIALSAADIELLRRVQKFFDNSGTIYRRPSRTFTGNGKVYIGCEMAVFRIVRIDECLRLVAHFLEYPLQGKKRRTFLAWKDMITIKVRAPKIGNDIFEVLAGEIKKANGGTPIQGW